MQIKNDPNNVSLLSDFVWFQLEEQPPELIYKIKCSWKFQKIYRKTPVPEALF